MTEFRRVLFRSDGDLGHHGDDGGEQSGVADIADRKFRALGVFGSCLTHKKILLYLRPAVLDGPRTSHKNCALPRIKPEIAGCVNFEICSRFTIWKNPPARPGFGQAAAVLRGQKPGETAGIFVKDA